jgi:hypothetical protein
MLLTQRKYFGSSPEAALDTLNDIVDAAPSCTWRDGLRVPRLSKQVLKGTKKGKKGRTPKKGGKAHYTASEAMRFALAR